MTAFIKKAESHDVLCRIRRVTALDTDRVINADRELLADAMTNAEVADVIAYLDELDVEIAEVGLVAGTLTQYLTYGLQLAGNEVVCMEARQVNGALSAMRNKTNKNDARSIAQLLRSSWLSDTHHIDGDP